MGAASFEGEFALVPAFSDAIRRPAGAGWTGQIKSGRGPISLQTRVDAPEKLNHPQPRNREYVASPSPIPPYCPKQYTQSRMNGVFTDQWPTASTSSTSHRPIAPPRASRTKEISNDIHHPNFTRTYNRPPSSSSISQPRQVTFSVGQSVVVGPGLIPNQKWLQRPASLQPKYQNGKRKAQRSKVYSGWRHGDGLGADDKVGIIVDRGPLDSSAFHRRPHRLPAYPPTRLPPK